MSLSKFNIGICGESASAEFKIDKYTSFVPSVSMLRRSFASESRLYFDTDNRLDNKVINPFMSCRVSSRKRVSWGFGSNIAVWEFISFQPTFGVAIDCKKVSYEPFISLKIGFGDW